MNSRKPLHGLTDHQARILIFLDEHPRVFLREWPRELRLGSCIASLKRRRLIVQGRRSPRRLSLTGPGSDLALWVSALQPRNTPSPVKGSDSRWKLPN
jgi:hypothetical protein